MKKRFIIVHGPTGVGKTEFISTMSQRFVFEVINGDVGQLYEPLSIGTAKPDWKNEKIPHHLFDRVTKPEDFSVVSFRNEVAHIMQSCWERKSIPIIVGGSLFYGKSLFFPPLQPHSPVLKKDEYSATLAHKTTAELWETLKTSDPVRALEIHKNDRYRIERALSVIHEGQTKASQQRPFFDPLEGEALILFLTRERASLYQRINERVNGMFKQGWIDEVKTLVGTEWENFLERKKLIGYTDILTYIKKELQSQEAYESMIHSIQQKTRHYAKRQETFWRMFQKKLQEIPERNRPLFVTGNLSNPHDCLMVQKVIKDFCLDDKKEK